MGGEGREGERKAGREGGRENQRQRDRQTERNGGGNKKLAGNPERK